MKLNIFKKDRLVAGGRVSTKGMGSSSVRAPMEVVEKVVNISGFNRLINFLILLLVFALPLLFLPTSSEAREFNKQALLFFAVVVMLGAWVIKILATRTISWVKTSLDYILLVYLLIYLVSSLLSIDKVSSFLGYYGRFTGSFISVLALVILYFLIVNNVRSESLTRKVVNYLTIGGMIVLVYSLLQFLGIHVIRLPFTTDRAFNPIGSMVALSIYTAVIVVLLQWQWLFGKSVTKEKNIMFVIMTVLGLIVMLLVNAFVGWLILGIGMIAFIALGLVSGKDVSSTWFWKPLLVLVVAILFVAFQFLPNIINPRSLININLPIEVQLSNRATYDLVTNSLKAKPILGFGPGTTGIAFGDIKPERLNKTVVWNLNFDRASTEFANIAIETGLLGLLAFELTAILFVIYGLYFLLKKGDQTARSYALGFFTLWLMLYASHFFYFFNTTLYFFYWLFLALFMAVTHWQEGEAERSSSLSLSLSPRSALSWMFASLLILALLLVGAFFQAAVYAAEVEYTQGLRKLNQPSPNFREVANKFARAVSLNNYRDAYYLVYGQNLIFAASEEAAKPQPDVAQIQNWISDIVAAGNSAVTLSPKKAANWSARAQFFNAIKPLVPTVDQAVIDSWNKALENDGKNPALYIQLARAYVNASEYIDPATFGTGADTDKDGLADSREQQLGSNPNTTDSNKNGVSDGDEVKAGFNPAGSGRLTQAQLAPFIKVDQNKLKEAEKALMKTIELKDDLPDSYIELSRVLEKSNRLQDARKQLDEGFRLFPRNADIIFEQGRLSFNQKNFEAAEGKFNEVLKVVPNHANARYSLGLIYLQRDDKAEALAEFEKARELSGPNIELDRLINSLKPTAPAPKK